MSLSHWVSAGFLGLFLTGHAAAATTYSYVGLPYTTATGVYTTAMRVQGSFTTASPLPPNLSAAIGPGGMDLVTDWSFSDGVNTFTKANSEVLYGQAAFFTVQTDASANIANTTIVLMSPQQPHAVGQTMQSFGIDSVGVNSDLATANGECTALNGVICTTLMPDVDSARVVSGGTWRILDASANAVAVPFLSQPMLLLLGAGLGWLGYRRQRTRA